MSLAWINPLYLAGLLLLALPVLIHMVQKHQSSDFRFPSLMFLQKIPLQQKRRLEIRHWWLLLIRCLILLLLALAFARPFFEQAADEIGLQAEYRDSIVVIDRSYSMRLGDRWQKARSAALDLIDNMRSEDRIGLVVFDQTVEILSELSADANELRRLVERLQPGLKTTHPRIAIEQADRLLSTSNAGLKRIHLISDFQASSVPGPVAKISSDTKLEPVEVSGAAQANASISAYSIEPSARAAADVVSVRIEVTNHSSETIEQQIGLAINGREHASQALQLPPRATLGASFDEINVTGKLLRGEIRLQDDGLMLDNRAYFVYSSKQRVPVLLIESAPARDNRSIYIENALALARKPAFRVETSSWSDLQSTDLSDWAVVIVNDESLPGPELDLALRDFVAAGGGLLLATGDAAQANWPSGSDGYLPGNLQRRIDTEPGQAQQIGALSEDHPLAGADLGGARIFSYRDLLPGPEDRVLARYADAAPALLERRFGAGKVLLLSTTLDTSWNDLPLRPEFLPFLHRLVRYLSRFETYANSVEVGSVVDVLQHARALAGSDAIIAGAGDSALIIETPGDGEIRLEREKALLATSETGFYQIHRATRSDDEVLLAVNIDPREAIPETLDVDRFVEEIMASASARDGVGIVTRRQAAAQESEQQLWFAILSLVLFLMLVEAFSANRIAAKRSNGIRINPV